MKQLVLMIAACLVMAEAPAQINHDMPANAGVEQQIADERQVQVYPNPTSGAVNIDLRGFGGQLTEVRIMNVIGNVVHHETVSSLVYVNKVSYDLSNFSKGLYYIKIESKDYSEIKKVIFR